MASSLQAVSQPQVKWLKQMGTAVWCEVCLRMNFGNSHMYDRMTAPQKLARVSSSSSSSSQHTNFIFSIHTMSRDCCAFTPCPYTLWIKNCRTIYFCCNLYVYLNVDRFSKFFHTISTSVWHAHNTVCGSKRSAISNTRFLGPTRVLNANGILIASAIFEGLTSVTDRQTTLLGRTNRPHLRK